MSTNLCNVINCPFSDKKNGCQKYSVSGHCHLLENSKMGTQFFEHKLSSPVPIILTDNQYWLFAQKELSEEDIAKFTKYNNDWISSDPVSQKRLQREKMLTEH